MRVRIGSAAMRGKTFTPIPLPPLAEQKRVVAKVDALMQLCDALEAALRNAEDVSCKLADALVAELLA